METTQIASVTACDFTRSYFFFQIASEQPAAVTITHPLGKGATLNQVRIPIESRCVIMDPLTNEETLYILGASCKTETVNVERNIWSKPNADFCPVVSNKGDFMIIKQLSHIGDDGGDLRFRTSFKKHQERQAGKACDAWQKHHIDIGTRKGVILESVEEIIKACIEKRTLVSRTEFEIDGPRRVILDYPIKTINYSERNNYYQVDTGPVLFPDLSLNAENFIGNLRLAYIAHNAPDWAEFIVNVPTLINEHLRVDHYSRAVHVSGKNTVVKII